jgi:hypothetical protein
MELRTLSKMLATSEHQGNLSAGLSYTLSVVKKMPPNGQVSLQLFAEED